MNAPVTDSLGTSLLEEAGPSDKAVDAAQAAAERRSLILSMITLALSIPALIGA